MSRLERAVKSGSQEEVKKAFHKMTAAELYEHNDMELLPSEADVLQRYLVAKPKYLFVDMPEDFWVGDELGVLKRHGFRLGVIEPFSSLFYGCAELLLSKKEVSIPVFTEEEITLIKSSDEFLVTKKMLVEIARRHGYSRFKLGTSWGLVSMESSKQPIAEGLLNALVERGLVC